MRPSKSSRPPPATACTRSRSDDAGDIPIELRLEAAAAGRAGFIVARGDGMCVSEGFCSSDETAIWTSADGRSWTRVPFGSWYPSGSATDTVA